MKTDDPKLTAYALGELPPGESAEMEALLCDDTALAAEIEATRNFASRLRIELQAEEGASLFEGQRAEVLAAADIGSRGTPAKIRAFPRRTLVLSAIAACLIVGLSLALLYPAMLAEKAAVERSMVLENGAVSDAARREGVAVPTIVLSQAEEYPAPSLATPDAGEPMIALSQPPKVAGNSVIVLGVRADSNGAPGNNSFAFVPSAPAVREQPAKVITQVSSVTAMPPGEAAGAGLTLSKSAGFTSASGGGVGVIGAGTWVVSGGFSSSGVTASEQEMLAFAGKSVADAALVRDPSDPAVMSEVFKGRPSGNQQPANTEAYDPITDNAFLPVKDHPLSTLSIDVDTASYSNVRRFLTSGSLPPKGAVRIEEMLNYFTYDYPQPAGDAPFSATMDAAACPWTPEHRLVRIGLKGRDLARSERPNANLVFLIDVSGSMNEPSKLPLVKESLRLLVDQLDDRDMVAIAVYAGASGTVLAPTRDKARMRAALDRLQAGGSTNGAGGIRLAYELAAKSFIKGGTNRVILATDGDFNVGITDEGALVELITKKAKSGVFLSVLGYGMGNLKDSTLEKLADKGNGNYGYIDTLAEAKKTLVQQMNGTLYTIAKDVKIQVEFNPAQASAYRLIGYENRLLAKEDFNDDKKDAGEIGAGHMVTALYEVVPAGNPVPSITPSVDALKYSAEPATKPAAEPSPVADRKPSGSSELFTLKLRYKQPDGDVSQKLEFQLTDRGGTWEQSSKDFRWAAAVASFGMLLRDSPHKGAATWDSTLELAHEGKGEDVSGYRKECLALIERAQSIWVRGER